MGDNIAFFCHVQVCLHEFQFLFILICYVSVVNKNKQIFKPRHITRGAIQIQRANPLQSTQVTVSHTADASEGSVWRERPRNESPDSQSEEDSSDAADNANPAPPLSSAPSKGKPTRTISTHAYKVNIRDNDHRFDQRQANLTPAQQIAAATNKSFEQYSRTF